MTAATSGSGRSGTERAISRSFNGFGWVRCRGRGAGTILATLTASSQRPNDEADPEQDPGPRICFCMKVHAATLRAAIAAGARSVEDLRRMTHASAGCGTCRPDLEAMLARAQVTEPR